MKDFQCNLDFLFIVQQSADKISMMTMPPDPKTVKKKALLLIKARQDIDEEDEAAGNFFPTGIEKEVIFMEITGKLLGNLYAACSVSLTLLCQVWTKFKFMSFQSG